MHSSPVSKSRPTIPASQLARNWLSLLFLLAGSPLRAQTPADIARLNQQVTPITAVRAGSGFADLAPLAPVVAPARVVALERVDSCHLSQHMMQAKCTPAK